MKQKYYRIEYIPDAKGRHGSIHAIELWNEAQLIKHATEMVRNDLKSSKINFELQKNDVNKTSYFSDGTTKFDVIDVDRQKYLGQVVATVI